MRRKEAWRNDAKDVNKKWTAERDEILPPPPSTPVAAGDGPPKPNARAGTGVDDDDDDEDEVDDDDDEDDRWGVDGGVEGGDRWTPPVKKRTKSLRRGGGGTPGTDMVERVQGWPFPGEKKKKYYATDRANLELRFRGKNILCSSSTDSEPTPPSRTGGRANITQRQARKRPGASDKIAARRFFTRRAGRNTTPLPGRASNQNRTEAVTSSSSGRQNRTTPERKREKEQGTPKREEGGTGDGSEEEKEGKRRRKRRNEKKKKNRENRDRREERRQKRDGGREGEQVREGSRSPHKTPAHPHPSERKKEEGESNSRRHRQPVALEGDRPNPGNRRRR